MNHVIGPDEVIFVCGDWRVTRREYEDRVARAVSGLRRLGIQPGDSIGIALQNRPQFFELLAATTAIGATSVPIAWRLKEDEVRYVVEDSRCKVVFFDEASAGSMAGVPGVSLSEYEQLLTRVEPASGVEATPTGFAFELYSSGTTGRPKAIEREFPPDLQGRPPDTRQLGFLTMLGVGEPGEVHLFCGPLYHSQPIGFAASALAAGHRVVMMPGSFDAEECLRTIGREQVTWMTCVPTHLIRILALPAEVRSRYDLSSLKAVFHSAAPCPRDVKARAMELFPPDTVWEVYGGTEGAMTMISPQEWRRKPGSVGRAFPPGSELRILDEKGKELPVGATGLVYSRPIMPFHYRGAPDLDAQTWRGELFTLGDVGYLDDDGYLFITDRVRDMIITGGANVYPAEVEAVLFNHPAVGDAAVIGVPDPEWGEAVMAIVEPRTEVTAAEIIEHCRNHLAHYKCPKSVELVDDLPRDPNGKVRKRELRQPFWAARPGERCDGMGLADTPYETVVVEQFDRVVRLTLNRPEKRNAICSTLQREVIDVVERGADDPTAHVVIIRGAGPSFCAGYDVSPAAAPTEEAPSVPRRAIGTLRLARGWSRIWDAPIPVIAQIHGHCLAGGTDLAQHCDLILTADNATIGFPAIRMGGTPPTNMWLYNVGPQWAKRLLLTGDTFTGRFAAKIGFALEAVPAAELDDHVMVLARRIAAVGRDIVAINKFIINTGLGLMGRDTLQEITAPMDAIANQATEMAEFNARAREVGLASAFKERDAQFRSGVPLDIPDR